MIHPSDQVGPDWLKQEIVNRTGITPTMAFYCSNNTTGPRLKAVLPAIPTDRLSLLRLNSSLKEIFGDYVSLFLNDKKNDVRVEILGDADTLEPRFRQLLPRALNAR